MNAMRFWSTWQQKSAATCKVRHSATLNAGDYPCIFVLTVGWVEFSAGRQGEDFKPVCGDADGMLKLR